MASPNGRADGGVRMRIQMTDPVTFGTPNVFQPTTYDSSLCGSAEAHASLRRFAEGYSFGTTSELGVVPTSVKRLTQPPKDVFSAPAPRTLSESVTSYAGPSSNPFEQTAKLQNGATLKPPHCSPKIHESVKWSNQQNHGLFQQSLESQVRPLRDNESEHDCLAKTEHNKKSQRRRERGTLVFGENAMRTPLPVRERIERRGTPKRLRDTIPIDTLATMIEDVLVTDRSGKKLFKRPDEKCSLQTLKSTTENLGALACNDKLDQENQSSIKVEKLRSDANNITCSGRGTIPEKLNESGQESKTTEYVKSDDDEVADELSFLVRKCDLESERKQSHFMPYIT